MSDTQVLAFSLNPLDWLGDAAGQVVGDLWKSAMTGLWSAALWILKLAFKFIDQFTQPDLSTGGPMRGILPTTLWLGAMVAGIMLFVQIGFALTRRDGESMGRIVLGIFQFGLVWVGYAGIAAGLVFAASGLTRGILEAMLNVDTMSAYDFSQSWPTHIDDITLATVLGVLSLLLVIPAAFFYVLIMLVRSATLIILVATAPISAGGLLSDVGKTWFWKTTRWFFACLLISPCAALMLGIGVKLADGAINPPPTDPVLYCAQVLRGDCNWDMFSDDNVFTKMAADANSSSAGMAIIGCIVIAIGAVCPLILFRLLAFVEPSTASGASLRQSWSDAGGMAGLVRGGKVAGGSGAALRSAGDGRSGGEAAAEGAAGGRLAGALGAAGAVAGAIGVGMRLATSLGQRAADIGSDVVGSAGVGSAGYSMTPTDERVYRRKAEAMGASRAQAQRETPPAEPPESPSAGDGPGPTPPPTPPPGPRTQSPSSDGGSRASSTKGAKT
jgi:hypothetical protein